MKKDSVSKAKKKAWNIFSKYIRLRDCLQTTGDKEYGICYTCGKQFHFKELQAGHGIAGRANSILFNEQLVNAQCRGCNLFKGGCLDVYTIKLINQYGKKQVEEWHILSRQSKPMKTYDFELIEEIYTDKFNFLNK